MSKIFTRAVIVYLLYALVIYWYFFHGATWGIPIAYEGTSADPTTFMSSQELILSSEFSQIRHFIFFLATPFEWLVMLFFLLSSLSGKVQDFCTKRIKYKIAQVVFYYFSFALFTFLCMLPIRFISYQLARHYNVSVQSLGDWLYNRFIDFTVDFILMIIIIQGVLYLLKRWEGKWWFIGWLLSIPMSVFFMFIQPIIIDPLYNEFRPIQNEQLEQKILAMAQEAGVPAEHVFEVEMSHRTNQLNAYVTGVGSNARIVLWDTSLERLTEEEIMFLMAHEIAHYVYRDVYKSIGVAVGFSFVGLFIIHQVLKKFGRKDLSRIPVALITVSVVTFAFSPLTNGISRQMEARADAFALEKTGDTAGGIALFQSFARAGLSEVHPPTLVRIFRGTHPSLLERISVLEQD